MESSFICNQDKTVSSVKRKLEEIQPLSSTQSTTFKDLPSKPKLSKKIPKQDPKGSSDTVENQDPPGLKYMIEVLKNVTEGQVNDDSMGQKDRESVSVGQTENLSEMEIESQNSQIEENFVPLTNVEDPTPGYLTDNCSQAGQPVEQQFSQNQDEVNNQNYLIRDPAFKSSHDQEMKQTWTVGGNNQESQQTIFPTKIDCNFSDGPPAPSCSTVAPEIDSAAPCPNKIEIQDSGSFPNLTEGKFYELDQTGLQVMHVAKKDGVAYLKLTMNGQESVFKNVIGFDSDCEIPQTLASSIKSSKRPGRPRKTLDEQFKATVGTTEEEAKEEKKRFNNKMAARRWGGLSSQSSTFSLSVKMNTQ